MNVSDPLPAPAYSGPAEDNRCRVGLAVASMARHMTDEGFQLFQGLRDGGMYQLCGHEIGDWLTDVPTILSRFDPGTVVVQDKREFMGMTADHSRDPKMMFRNVGALKERPDVFTLTILKDAQHNNWFHRQSADEMGVHCWICYYAPKIVKHLAPFVREEHLIRTWHTLDKNFVPTYSPYKREGALLSGALSRAYPLRQRIAQNVTRLPMTTLLRHPGYHRNGCQTPDYIKFLTRFKVSICTASIYGYALRKLAESTAAGCVVLTDLPRDDVLPDIDDNLVRVRPDATVEDVADLLRCLIDGYDPEKQRYFSDRAVERFDFRVEGKRLADAIETMRKGFSCR